MVSFQCDGCADTVKKPQLDKHRQRCWAPFTCLDCSTTFNNGEYKTHTSCISEAEKYQGALYRGPRKGPAASNAATPSAAASGTSTPAAAQSESDAGAGTTGIHPSRLTAMAQPERPAFAPRGRGGFAARGRGGFGGRGGYGNGQSQSFNAGPPVPSRKEVTGENRTAPEGGMRAWGSAPTSDSEAIPLSTKVAAASSVDGSGDAEKKKKKRKGDKGGTGAKANSRLMAEAAEAAALAAAAAEPAAKKRKRDNDESTAASTPAPAPAAAEGSAAPSDKTLKRIKKHMAKLEDKTAAPVPLAQWLASVGANKDKTVERGDILAGVQVTFVDGRWQLSL